MQTAKLQIGLRCINWSVFTAYFIYSSRFVARVSQLGALYECTYWYDSMSSIHVQTYLCSWHSKNYVNLSIKDRYASSNDRDCIPDCKILINTYWIKQKLSSGKRTGTQGVWVFSVIFTKGNNFATSSLLTWKTKLFHILRFIR